MCEVSWTGSEKADVLSQREYFTERWPSGGKR